MGEVSWQGQSVRCLVTRGWSWSGSSSLTPNPPPPPPATPSFSLPSFLLPTILSQLLPSSLSPSSLYSPLPIPLPPPLLLFSPFSRPPPFYLTALLSLVFIRYQFIFLWQVFSFLGTSEVFGLTAVPAHGFWISLSLLSSPALFLSLLLLSQ